MTTLDIPGAFAAYRELLEQCNIPYLNTLGLVVCRSHQHDMIKLHYPPDHYRVWSQVSGVRQYNGFRIIDADHKEECFLCQQGGNHHANKAE